MNAQILPQILQRYSPMAFSDKEISDADIRLLVEAARWSPSAYNEQPWRFVFATKGNELYTKIHSCLVDYNKIWSETAPLLAAVYSKTILRKDETLNASAEFDTGTAVGILTLQAMHRGIYAHAMGGYNHQQLDNILGASENVKSICIIAFGYPGDTSHLPVEMQQRNPHNRVRKSAQEISSINESTVLSF